MEASSAKDKGSSRIDGGGNYFVSNYPPYPFWSTKALPETLNALQRAPEEQTPLGVYIHVPFCRQRCHFCYFKVYTGRTAKDVEHYMKVLAEEARLISQVPRFKGRTPRFLYFGGGTPSYLSQKLFSAFMENLSQSFDLSTIEEFTFECEPGTISLEKLKALKKAGVTRASIGVEHFDDRVLVTNNRAHNKKAIMKAFDNARKAGFSQINLDLIAGMPGDDDEKWFETVSQTIALLPESVTIYQLEFPYNTTFSKWDREQGGLPTEAPSWETKRRWLREAFDRLEQAGYELTSGYTARLKSSKASFIYRDALWSGADMLGLGVSAFSHVEGHHFQNEKEIERYIEKIEKGELTLARGYNLSDTESLIRECILQLKHGRLRLDYFQRKFGVNLTSFFKEPLDSLEKSGLMSRNKDTLSLNREALLQVDALLPQFFLPQHSSQLK